MHLIGLRAVAALILAGGQPAAVSQHEWMRNCVWNFESPDALAMYRQIGRLPPIHEENVFYCARAWNAWHPHQLYDEREE